MTKSQLFRIVLIVATMGTAVTLALYLSIIGPQPYSTSVVVLLGIIALGTTMNLVMTWNKERRNMSDPQPAPESLGFLRIAQENLGARRWAEIQDGAAAPAQPDRQVLERLAALYIEMATKHITFFNGLAPEHASACSEMFQFICREAEKEIARRVEGDEVKSVVLSLMGEAYLIGHYYALEYGRLLTKPIEEE